MRPSPKNVALEAWRRFTDWVRAHQRLARLAALTSGLILFLVILPAYLRVAFWNGLISNKIVAGMLVVFSVLSLSLVWTTGQKLDAWVFLLLNFRGSRPAWLDWVMLGFTQLGNGIASLGIALVIFLSGNRLLSYELVLGALTLWLVVEVVKFFVHRSRPFIRLTQARIVGYRASGRSFPSGHTSQAFFMATLTAQHFHAPVWAVVVLYGTAFLVGVTRMYVGAHYPRDVLAGAILGSAWGLLGVIVDGYLF
jgi:membrane-associated phospholipid phosphatase